MDDPLRICSIIKKRDRMKAKAAKIVGLRKAAVEHQKSQDGQSIQAVDLQTRYLCEEDGESSNAQLLESECLKELHHPKNYTKSCLSHAAVSSTVGAVVPCK
ncbi:hypothetical protein ACLOJK_019244 [Asimina triloba]